MFEIEWASVGFNLGYDMLKFIISYLIARSLYDGVYKNIKYGGWTLEMADGEAILATRDITPRWAEKILNDDYDFSVYVKGFASPYVYLNIDVCSDRAKQEKLIVLDRQAKKFIIDRSKNPAKQEA